jgi:hypothetical protein
MKGLLRACAAIGAAAFSSAQAHHSASAIYDPNSKITIEGTLVSIQLMNPHSFVTIQVEDESGSFARWTAEWLSYRGLATAGVTRATLRPGDRLILTGLPARKIEEHRVLLRRIERSADGWEWSGSGEED